MSKRKVALFYTELSHYRVPILKLVAKEVELTVVCGKFSGNKEELNFDVNEVEVKKFGPFYYFRLNGFFKYISQFDVIIGLMDLRLIQFILLFLAPIKCRYALWGIGMSASYTKKFNSQDIQSKIRSYLASKANSVILYSEKPKSLFKSLGYPEEKIHIAHNTISNDYKFRKNNNKDSFLFIGTLYQAKGIEDLLNQYVIALKKREYNLPKLNIVGDGELRSYIESYISRFGLSNHIKLVGAIYCKDELIPYFEDAILTISPNQAGLSVLTSMSYGVPFVTCQDAITGGEILNIKDGYNGVIIKDKSEISNIFIDSSSNKEKYIEMGVNAYNFYKSERSPEIMARAVINCVDNI
ncbi:glycosyltransferase family 4 protein [Nitrincola sp.]|uniref:glycosyltransferase family 4 protein n=1 Tax=Nitrincola sp. TaxID=1926584 RepID=UPI003A915DDA